MKKGWKAGILCCVVLLSILGVMMLVFSKRAKDALDNCSYSIYDIEENFSRQYYVVASYSVDVYEQMIHEDTIIPVNGYVVEKKDKDGKYRTVYDSVQGLTPTTQELVSKSPYNNTIYKDMNLQPLVDVYGEGEYRVINVGNSTSENEALLAHEYYVVSGKHLENNDSFMDTFLFDENDLKALSIRNGQVTYELTEAEKDKFIEYILNMKCVAVNEKQRSYIIACMKGDGYEFGWNYHINLNLPEHNNCYIYNMTGKDLDGNTYQAVFRSGDTLVCLDSEENLLIMLDALKQKHNQRVQANK